jgi:hypothetical protein
MWGYVKLRPVYDMLGWGYVRLGRGYVRFTGGAI